MKRNVTVNSNNGISKEEKLCSMEFIMRTGKNSGKEIIYIEQNRCAMTWEGFA